MKRKLTLDQLNTYFYIKNSKLYWKITKSNHFNAKNKADDMVGTIWTTPRHKSKYLRCFLLGHHYPVHRIMYQMYHGLNELDDKLVIDHIDRNGLNNSIENLRLVTQRENILNRDLQKNNTSGESGINYLKKNKKWSVRVTVLGIGRKFIGLFDTFELARKAKKEFEEETLIIGDENDKVAKI